MSSQSENANNEIIDVKIDDKRRQYIKELLNKNGFYVPERDFVQLVKLNLLNYLVQMVEEDNQMKPWVSNILKQHSIYIPEKFYQPLVNKNLFWKLIRAIHFADIKRQLEQLDQLPIDHSDDDDDNDDKDTQQTQFFSIDTEGDFITKQPAIIQIELINRNLSQVLLLEACHLPRDQTCLQSWLIRSQNTIYVWGNGMKELSQFIDSGLFTLDLLKQPKLVNLQIEFGRCHQNQTGMAIKGKNLWGLQAAIDDQFEEHLEKRLPLNRWSQSFTFILKKKKECIFVNR